MPALAIQGFAWLSVRVFAGLCLGLAAAFRHRLGEIGKEDREPQPKDDLKSKTMSSPPPISSLTKMTVVRRATASTTNMTGFRIIVERIQLDESRSDRR